MSKPSFCWWCSRSLTSIKSRPNDGVLVKDAIGNSHRVHKVCAPAAKANAKQITAANNEAYHGDIDGDFDYW